MTRYNLSSNDFWVLYHIAKTEMGEILANPAVTPQIYNHTCLTLMFKDFVEQGEKPYQWDLTGDGIGLEFDSCKLTESGIQWAKEHVVGYAEYIAKIKSVNDGLKPVDYYEQCHVAPAEIALYRGDEIYTVRFDTVDYASYLVEIVGNWHFDGYQGGAKYTNLSPLPF